MLEEGFWPLAGNEPERTAASRAIKAKRVTRRGTKLGTKSLKEQFSEQFSGQGAAETAEAQRSGWVFDAQDRSLGWVTGRGVGRGTG